MAVANAVNVIAFVIKWAQENGLILNSQKSQAIFISPYARKKFKTPSLLTSSTTWTSIVPNVHVFGITITQDLKWATYATGTQKSVGKMLGDFNGFGSALNINCRCHILQAFMLPKQSHCTLIRCYVGNPVVNAINTTLQCAASIALRKKTATLDWDMNETTGILPICVNKQYKSFCRVNSLLFIDNSESYLPSLITESDSQHATRSVSSYKFRLPEHNRSADEDCFYYAKNVSIMLQPNYGIIYIG